MLHREAWEGLRSLIMLSEKYTDLNQRKQLEFNNLSKEIVPWHNSYVIYDYEPFCSDGFEINLVVSSNSREHLEFLKYLYDNKINTIEYLNNCVIS